MHSIGVHDGTNRTDSMKNATAATGVQAVNAADITCNIDDRIKKIITLITQCAVCDSAYIRLRFVWYKVIY